MRQPRHSFVISVMMTMMLASATTQAPGADGLASLENQFTTLPVEARRHLGPLFWLHGDEGPELLTKYVQKVAEGGNGCFTTESRPHNDWLGPGWYRDLGVCLEAAKKNNLKMWIFDERWWPSQMVGGNVPAQYGSKFMDAEARTVKGPQTFQADWPADEHRIALIAGRLTEAGTVDGQTLIDLSRFRRDSRLTWSVPAGQWSIMTFSWRYAGAKGHQKKWVSVDGASRDCVDWYIQHVYQPHYDHFAQSFGKTIVGYFYDEPETQGDWGTQVLGELKRQNVDWKKALVAWKFKLADADEQVAANYQYRRAFAEAWGRTLYGGITEWCHAHHVKSIGHFMEHNHLYLRPTYCAGNMFQLQKYSDMGAIDAVFRQFAPGHKDDSTYQTPKLGSSISHAYGKPDDRAMVEIFGARGQDLTYPEMKWWADHMQVSGINFFIPHSFNPRSPYDRDCPPYFYNNGYEPRWPLYRVFADYAARLSLMLSGGRHVCPVALLFLGQSAHVGKALTPEKMTTALQDSLFDCDWMPYDVFEKNTNLVNNTLQLRKESYRVLVMPAAEVVPYDTLAKAQAFFDAGGIVIGYGMRPVRSATPGYGAADVAAICKAIWGDPAQPGLTVCRTNGRGGRTYFLPAEPTPEQMQQVLTADAAVHPAIEVLSGQTDHWLHVLHREKAGRDVFFITNQHHNGPVKHFRLRAHASGVPECWDPMRNTITAIDFERFDSQTVDFNLTLQPNESVLIVFNTSKRPLARRIDGSTPPALATLTLKRLPFKVKTPTPAINATSPMQDCHWVWHGADPAALSKCRRYFRGQLAVRKNQPVKKATMFLTADNRFTLYVNGQRTGMDPFGREGWRMVKTIALTKSIKAGVNTLAIEVINFDFDNAANPAGLIGKTVVQYADGTTDTVFIDGSWRSSDRLVEGWQKPGFDDHAWPKVKVLAAYGGGDWGRFDRTGGRLLTLSAVKADPFRAEVDIPADWLAEGKRIDLECDSIAPEPAAAIRVNGRYVGGFIGQPLRYDLTGQLTRGRNTITILPFAPHEVRLTLRKP